MMKELVEYIVKSLVDHPEDVRVTEREERGKLWLELSVNGSDMGRVIGKGGRVINSIRSLVDASAAKSGKNVSLDLLEDR